ncbi:protein LURP-one-related 11 [Brachypodium distachyon]|uniref:Protein LURP-one-related 11 n=1 Tax=Brachypodium distachyon TaxID=15368 RepID=A0A0Q3J9Y0_BRADI|nr:protein LURP-one-related 11 [Brachypodium distachyon]KQK14699.1 hypothetical protein BRADI_1g18150v3 [Brachypodium distachyon]|eukprot:XP_003562474.1 protein LURP-one-related 11 [Brachypodium distachyon]
MARVYSSSSSSSPVAAAMAASGQRREVFTVWMKSLVLNGRGCTVYDSGGRIVYRVDNYGSRSCHDVCLMDLHGGIVLNILKKKLAFGKWEGYKWSNDRKQQAWFTVARPPLFRRTSHQSSSSSCEFETEPGHTMRYRIDGGEKRACCRIVDEATGAVVAEVKRKVTAGGVALGEDVLALVVEPGVDHSLIMGLVLIYGLMNRTM